MARWEPDARQRLVAAALDLFTEQGYDKTSLRQIAEPLGFTQAAIYYHFAAKEDILVALHLRLHELGRPAFEQLGKEAGPSGWAAVLRGLVEDSGTDPETGAILYRTTGYFLERLGMASLDELPDLAPFLPENIEDIEDNESTRT